MLSTLGLILTVSAALVSSLITAILLTWRPAGRAPRRSKQDSAATPTEKDPLSLEARFLELQREHAFLCSEFEKVLKLLSRLNSREGMRELRARSQESQDQAPPAGTSKAELLRYYGMAGKVGPAFAQSQLELEHSKRSN